MCGFAGYIHNYGTFDKEEIIHKMADRIKHRGPDDAHYYIDDGIALGFRRLSIIDLEGGRQPIINEDGSLVLLFNGEIYNYQELREELIKAGHVFTTKTDSETILHGYEEYGKKILDRLRGMFAFIIWNKNTKELFGARDIFGIKPFYYYKKGKEFMFGSEIKSFLSHPNFEKELDEDMIPLYLSYEYSPDERTIFKNVFKLPGAHCFTYKNGELKVERYYKIQIDNYAVVNFASFPKIIDSLGGVTITITDREINEINNHPKRYGNVYIEKSYEGTEGKQKLNGKQALAYCRIRKIDTDNARADRQKTVLLQVFKKMKGSSTTELLKVVNDLVGYVYTGYSKKELLSLATYALSNGWMNYETQTFSVPTPDHARGGTYLIGPTQLTPSRSGGGLWLWKSDIPQDAYDLQMKIYGKSNIKLAENRCDYCNLL